MARYIDADALIKKIYPMGIGDGKYTINAKAVKLAIENFPSADVVPKSEADFLRATKNLHEAEFNEIKAELELRNAEIDTLKIAKAEVAREIFEEIEELLKRTCEKGYGGSISDLLAELKKKYTEGK